MLKLRRHIRWRGGQAALFVSAGHRPHQAAIFCGSARATDRVGQLIAAGRAVTIQPHNIACDLGALHVGNRSAGIMHEHFDGPQALASLLEHLALELLLAARRLPGADQLFEQRQALGAIVTHLHYQGKPDACDGSIGDMIEKLAEPTLQAWAPKRRDVDGERLIAGVAVRLPTAVRCHPSPPADHEFVTRPGAVTHRLAAAPNLDGAQAQRLQGRKHGAPAVQKSAAEQGPQQM